MCPSLQPLALVSLTGSLAVASSVAAQTTRDACLIPSVGVIYLINVETTGEECITGHTPIALNGPLSDGSITTATLADGAVTTEKIADGTITAAKLDPAVTIGVEPGSIGTVELAAGAVTSEKIAPGAVDSMAILDGSVTSSRLAPGLLMWARVPANGAIGSGSPQSGDITALRTATGVWNVTFPRPVDLCVYSVTSISGKVIMEGTPGPDVGLGSNVVYVRAGGADGIAASLPFHIVVLCG